MRIKRKGLTLNIFPDDIESPREYYKDSNITKMICFHRNYQIGDEHGFENPAEFAKWVKNNEKNIEIIKPLYLLDHSGITISTHDFMDPWDSGQVGYVYVMKDQVKDYDKSIVNELLEDEVKQYANWLAGIPQYF